MKRKKKQEEQEQLLLQQNANEDVELEVEEHGLANQGMEEGDDMFAPSPIVVKELNEEAMREVDALLEERLGELTALHWKMSNVLICPGDLAWSVVRYLGRPRPRRNNTMPVKNTAAASLRYVEILWAHNHCPQVWSISCSDWCHRHSLPPGHDCCRTPGSKDVLPGL